MGCVRECDCECACECNCESMWVRVYVSECTCQCVCVWVRVYMYHLATEFQLRTIDHPIFCVDHLSRQTVASFFSQNRSTSFDSIGKERKKNQKFGPETKIRSDHSRIILGTARTIKTVPSVYLLPPLGHWGKLVSVLALPVNKV